MNKSLFSVVCIIFAVVTAFTFSACSKNKPQYVAYSDIGQNAVQSIVNAEYLTINLNEVEVKSGEEVVSKIKGQLKLRNNDKGYDALFALDVIVFNNQIQNNSDVIYYNIYSNINVAYVNGNLAIITKEYQKNVADNAPNTFVDFDTLSEDEYTISNDFKALGTLYDLLNNAGVTQMGIEVADLKTVVKSVLTKATQVMEGQVEESEVGYNYNVNLSADELINGISGVIALNMTSSLGDFIARLLGKTQQEVKAIIDQLFVDNQTVGGFITTLETAIGKPNFVKNFVNELQDTLGLSTSKIVNIINPLLAMNGVTIQFTAEEGKTLYVVVYPVVSVYRIDALINALSNNGTSDTSNVDMAQIKNLVKQTLFGSQDGTEPAMTVQELITNIETMVGVPIFSFISTIQSSGTAFNIALDFDSNYKLNSMQGSATLNIFNKEEVETSLMNVAVKFDVELNYDAIADSEFDSKINYIKDNVSVGETNTVVITNKKVADIVDYNIQMRDGTIYSIIEDGLEYVDGGNGIVYQSNDAEPVVYLEIKQVNNNVEIKVYDAFIDKALNEYYNEFCFTFVYGDGTFDAVVLNIVA